MLLILWKKRAWPQLWLEKDEILSPFPLLDNYHKLTSTNCSRNGCQLKRKRLQFHYTYGTDETFTYITTVIIMKNEFISFPRCSLLNSPQSPGFCTTTSSQRGMYLIFPVSTFLRKRMMTTSWDCRKMANATIAHRWKTIVCWLIESWCN